MTVCKKSKKLFSLLSAFNPIFEVHASKRKQMKGFTIKNLRRKIMGKVTKEMNIIEIVQNYPESIEVFQKYGLGCVGCAAARFENLEAGAKVHGFDPDVMVADINALIKE